MIDPLAAPLAADIVAAAIQQLMIRRTRRHVPRVTAQKQMGARMSQAAPVGDASIPAASATDAFIAAFSWRLLSGA